MAIVNSTLMGFARNKIGNVVFRIVHGQTIASEYNQFPKPSATETQVNNRNQFKDAVQSYQYLSEFLSEIYPWRKKLESKFNCWVRYTKFIFAPIGMDNGWQSADLLSGYIIGPENWIHCIKIDWTLALPTLKFFDIKSKWDNYMFARMITFNEADGSFTIEDSKIYEADYNNGSVAFPETAENLGTTFCYIYSTRAKKCSNLTCIQIT